MRCHTHHGDGAFVNDEQASCVANAGEVKREHFEPEDPGRGRRQEATRSELLRDYYRLFGREDDLAVARRGKEALASSV